MEGKKSCEREKRGREEERPTTCAGAATDIALDGEHELGLGRTVSLGCSNRQLSTLELLPMNIARLPHCIVGQKDRYEVGEDDKSKHT